MSSALSWGLPAKGPHFRLLLFPNSMRYPKSEKYFDVTDNILSSSQYEGLTMPIVEFL